MPSIGYYKLIHRPTGQFYIGSSGNLNKRLWRHRTELMQGIHTNRRLQAIYSSWDDFEVHTFLSDTLEEARQMEQVLLDRHVGSPLCCNLSRSSTNPFDVLERIPPSREISIRNLEKANDARRGKPLTPEHKARLSESQRGRRLTPEQRAAISIAHKGRKLDEAHIEAIRQGNLGKTRTEEHKKIISELKSRKVSIAGVVYPSLKAAAAAHHLSDVTVRKRLKDNVSYNDWFYLE